MMWIRDMRATAVALLCVVGLGGAARVDAAARMVPLIEAVKNADTVAARRLILQKANVNVTEPDGTTALHWAADHGDAAMVDMLIKAGATVKVANRYGATPLGLAAAKGHAQVLERLLKAGENANAVVTGEPVLMMAARSGSADAVKILLANGANVNVRENVRAQTALMWAAAAGNTAVVKVLLEGGADIKARSASPGTGLEKGAGFMIPRVNDPIGLRANRDSTSWGIVLDGLQFTPLMWAARAGQIETVQALLDGGADINEAKPEGTTSLILATINNHWELASYLLDRGADPNKGPGYNALHQLAWARRINIAAAFHPGHPEPTGTVSSLDVARKMLAKGVNINAQMTESFKDNMRNRFQRIGSTPFMLASKLVDLPLMKLLLENGADRKILNKDNDTPLMAAAGVGLHNPGEDAGTEAEVMAAVKFLLDLGEDLHVVNKNNETALHGAAYRGFNTVVQFLIDKGAKLDVKNVLGWTPLSITDGAFYSGLYHASPSTSVLLRQNYVKQGLPVPAVAGVNDQSALTLDKGQAGTYEADLKKRAEEAAKDEAAKAAAAKK